MNKVKLKDIAQIKMGQSPDSRYYNSEEQGIPFLQGCAQFGKTYPSTSVYCSLPSKIARKGSILFSVRAPVGDINIADCDYCIGRGLAAITPKNINNEFLYYLLVFEKYQLIKIAQGSTFESINSTELENWLLPNLDSIPEQQQIAKILDTVDKAIAQTETLIAKYKRVKTGLMQDLLTRGIDENGQLRDRTTHKFKRSPLGMIPLTWISCNLKDVTNNIVGGGTPSRSKSDYWSGDIPWTSVKDFTDDLQVLYNTEESITKKGLMNSAANLIEAGIPVICTRMAVGRAAITFIPTAINQDLKALYPSSQINSKYLLILLKFYRQKLESLAIGSTVKGIRIEELLFFSISIPPLSEQEKIINILDNAGEIIINEQKKLTKLQKIKTGLMQDLLTGKISVKPLLITEP